MAHSFDGFTSHQRINQDLNLDHLDDFDHLDDNDNFDNSAPEDFDINDYELSTEDQEFKQYYDLINIFTVYYKSLYQRDVSSNLFEGIDNEDDTSTNRALEMFYDETKKYKDFEEKFRKIYDAEEYKSTFKDDKHMLNDLQLFSVIINDKKRYTFSLMAAIVFISEHDWLNDEWSINRLNMF
jgi:hypothetical protein